MGDTYAQKIWHYYNVSKPMWLHFRENGERGWGSYDNGADMLYLAGQTCTVGTHSHQVVAAAAMACAQTAPGSIPRDNEALQECIRGLRSWLAGGSYPAQKRIRDALPLAYTSTRGLGYVDRLTVDAYLSACEVAIEGFYAGNKACAAANAAACAAARGRVDVSSGLARCAAIVRSHFPRAPKLSEMYDSPRRSSWHDED